MNKSKDKNEETVKIIVGFVFAIFLVVGAIILWNIGTEIGKSWETGTLDKDITFVIKSGLPWTSCYNSTSAIVITYDLSSSSAVDLIFTPTKKDIENLNSTSQHYSSCYLPNILKTKGGCTISGEGCMALLNRNLEDATIRLKYSVTRSG